MKKLITLSLLGVSVVLLSGCLSKNNPETTKTTGDVNITTGTNEIKETENTGENNSGELNSDKEVEETANNIIDELEEKVDEMVENNQSGN